MATKKSTIDYLLDQLSPAKARARAMFGEYALYCQDKVVALVCDDELFVKITAPGKEMLGEDYQEGRAYPGAKPSMRIRGDLWEDGDFLIRLVQATARALPVPKPPRKRNLNKANKQRKESK